MRLFDPLLDIFRGKAVTIPPMDGALKPNEWLESAGVLAEAERPDCLAHDGTSLLYSSGNAVMRLGAAPVGAFESTVTALAVSPTRDIAVGLASGKVVIGNRTIDGFRCPTALSFDGEALLVCNGSESLAPEDWAKDLMTKGASGSVWRVNVTTGEKACLARGLAWPCGIVADVARNRVVISEAWAHRLTAVPMTGGSPSPVLPRLPAYPCRIAPSSSGYVLALFAPLNRLVEFVLQEDGYRADMMREIDSRYWIAPTLSASHSFLEPLQNGGVKSMGVHKPWSPTRSYGLVVTLDRDFRPVASFHSRANGRRHGITSAIEADGRIVAASKGGNMILSIDPAGAAS